MTGRATRALVPFALAVLLAGCGGDDGGGPPPWSDARVAGVAEASDVTIDGDVLLIVAGGDDRRLHVVARPDLRAGGTAPAKALPLEVRGEARLVGTDEFAGVGYTAGDLWSQAVDLQGVATHPPDRLYVADRTYRVVYSGPLRRGADGRPTSVHLDRLFAVPGADRKGRTRSDWRDTGPGLAGLTALAALAGQRQGEDLVAVERHGAALHERRVWRLDRFGQVGKWFGVSFPDEPDADVGGVAVDGDRFLLVRGAGRGTVAAFPEGVWARTRPVELGEPGPPPPPGAAWRGIAQASDGTTYLVSSGPECHVAWRPKPPKR